jgi:hypothetical protein
MWPIYLFDAACHLVSATPNEDIKFVELFYLHSYKNLESGFCNTTLLYFYKLTWPHGKFPLFCNLIWQLLSLFCKYFTSEQFFSKVYTVKNPHTTQLNDDARVESFLCIATSQISPDINILVNNKQCHFSHWSYFFLNSCEQWINKCKQKARGNTNYLCVLSSFYWGFILKETQVMTCCIRLVLSFVLLIEICKN